MQNITITYKYLSQVLTANIVSVVLLYTNAHKLNVENINRQIRFKRLMQDIRCSMFIRSMGKQSSVKNLNREISRLRKFRLSV